MTNKEKIVLLEEMLDVDEGTLTEEMELTEVENWDSMAILSLIALIDDKFEKPVSAAQIKQFKTIGQIIEFMG